MAVMAGDLVTRLGVDGRGFQRGLQNARSEMRSFVGDVAKIASGLAIFDIGKRAISGLIDMAKATVELAANAQTAQITFEVLTGDAAKGAKLFKDIEKFAARTSFDLTSAAEATKSLLAAGVADSNVMDTMQLLGDLAMGDAAKLGFLSKAYTDVMNKGKLQGQEIRQFAENGVGIVGALASAMNKTNAEILEMSEAGKISFTDMKNALESLTGPGGRFFGMMARINETFTGQWNSLVENIQTFGRDLGAMVLPRLTEIVAYTNQVLQKINEMPDKAKYIADVLDASMDVAFESIKEKWGQMLFDMVKKAMSIDWKDILLPGKAAADVFLEKMQGQQIGNAGGLGAAQNRLNQLLEKIKPQAAAQNPMAGFEWQGPREQGFAAGILRNMKPKPGELGDAFGKLFSAIGNDPLITSTKSGISGMLDRAKLQAGAVGGMLSGWLGTDRQKTDAKPQSAQLAGAMQQGSQEAYSTLVQNVLTRTTDPVVKATQEQTKQLIKAMQKSGKIDQRFALSMMPGGL